MANRSSFKIPIRSLTHREIRPSNSRTSKEAPIAREMFLFPKFHANLKFRSAILLEQGRMEFFFS